MEVKSQKEDFGKNNIVWYVSKMVFYTFYMPWQYKLRVMLNLCQKTVIGGIESYS